MKVSSGEKLTRFIRYGSHFSIEANRVKPDAFLPHKKSVDISVFRISELTSSRELSKDEIWEIGREHVQTEDRPIKARADLLASNVYDSNLEVVPDEPPERHANIRPLPVDNSPANRKARRALATKLANLSKLVIPPEEN